MRLQETYKPIDFSAILKNKKELPIHTNTLLLICNYFEKLNSKDRKHIKLLLKGNNHLVQEMDYFRKQIWNIEKLRFKNEIEIIEIFQKNNI